VSRVVRHEGHSRYQLAPDGPANYARVPSLATGPVGTGKLRVALDLRDLPPEQVGTRTYAVNLARALVKLPEIDLTLLVQNPSQSKGMTGRVVTADAWADDVEVIHKPGQVVDPALLRLLFESSAQLVITYQDLIAFRIPLVFGSDARFESYRATSRLVLPATQRLIAYSESVRSEIVAEFGIPRDEISVVMLGGDNPSDSASRLASLSLRLPRRFFFSLASDYPHKNLRSLLDAYGQFRNRWKQGEAPQLVLAGYSSGARNGLYPQLETTAAPAGVIFLGPVSPGQLRVLYRRAEALVFASLYEGFGLPPLEAMTLGTPVIAMPISAMPEVGGDGVLYCDGLSAKALARAMERVATEEDLRGELREKGYARAKHFHWEKTARETFAVYKSAVSSPSERSLRMRRLLHDSIIDWSEQGSRQASDAAVQSLGIRDAYRVFETAARTRLRRALRRLRPMAVRKP
jgi:glycosyltransferase involved in cell wall biosynthesis